VAPCAVRDPEILTLPRVGGPGPLCKSKNGARKSVPNRKSGLIRTHMFFRDFGLPQAAHGPCKNPLKSWKWCRAAARPRASRKENRKIPKVPEWWARAPPTPVDSSRVPAPGPVGRGPARGPVVVYIPNGTWPRPFRPTWKIDNSASRRAIKEVQP